MGRQLQHITPSVGDACARCGLVYSSKTAYVPCFEEGDTFETWKARQPEAIQPLLLPPDDPGIRKPSAVAGALSAARLAFRRLDAISSLIAAHLQEAKKSEFVATVAERDRIDADFAALVDERDRLIVRMQELEAELAGFRDPSLQRP